MLEKVFKMEKVALQQTISPIFLLEFRFLGLFPSFYVPAPSKETIAIVNTQPSKIQGENWILIANSCNNLFFADSLGGEKYNFSSSNTIREKGRTNTVASDCGSSKMYAAYQFFRHEKYTKFQFSM